MKLAAVVFAVVAVLAAIPHEPELETADLVIEEMQPGTELLAIDTAGNLIILPAMPIEGFVWDPDPLDWPEGTFSPRCRGSIRHAAEMRARAVVCFKTAALARWVEGQNR